MNQKKFLISSFSWVAAANIITKPLYALLFIYAARVLGTEQYGIYTYAISIVIITSIFIDFGFDYLAIREVSKNNNRLNDYLNRVLVSRFFLFLLLAFFLIVFLALNNKLFLLESSIILLLLVFQTSTILLQFFRALISSLQAFNLFAKMMIFEKLLLSIIGFISLLLSNELIYFVTSLLAGNLVSLILFILILKIKYKAKFHVPKFANLKSLIIEAVPLIIMNIFIMAYFRVDVIVLDYFVNDKSTVGIYGAIHRIIEMYILFPTVLMSTAYPIITKNFDLKKEFVRDLVHKILIVLVFVTIPIVLLISLNSYRINLLLFGEQYIEGYKGLMIIIWSIIPLGFNYVLGHLLIGVNKQNYCALSVGLASIINIVLNIILIPKYSFVRTSIAVLITESIIFIFYSFFVFKYFGKINMKYILWKMFIIISIVLVIFGIYTYYFDYNLIFSLSLITASTGILFLLTGFLRWKFFKDLMLLLK